MEIETLDTDVTENSLMKRDEAGTIELLVDGDGPKVRRDPTRAAWLLRCPARWIAGNEARTLARLPRHEALPRLLSWDGTRLLRSYIPGRPMHEVGPRDLRYYREARRLLHWLHRHGVAHNDLAKEANWLVTPEGGPALVDFQLAWHGNPRGRFFRLLARDDLRHLLKQKHRYCPDKLTPVERRLLAKRSWMRRAWFATWKPVYHFITRKVFNWRDNEGNRIRT